MKVNDIKALSEDIPSVDNARKARDVFPDLAASAGEHEILYTPGGEGIDDSTRGRLM